LIGPVVGKTLEADRAALQGDGMKPTTAVLPIALAMLAVAPALATETAIKMDSWRSATITLTGEDGKSQTVSMLDMNGLPRASASITHEGKTFGFKGVVLAELLKRVNAPLGKDLRGPALSDVVIVTTKDGYEVVLPLSDLELSIQPSTVILADETAEGVPLGEKDGPFRLVVGGDLKPARSERNVVAIEVRRLRRSH
jgi:hypothetical protein